jgi:antitoxin MazE
MESKVRKWGNSLGIRIPKSVADDVGLTQDCEVSLEVARGQLIVRPKSKACKLDELLSKLSPGHIHSETDWGKPLGKEIW